MQHVAASFATVQPDGAAHLVDEAASISPLVPHKLVIDGVVLSVTLLHIWNVSQHLDASFAFVQPANQVLDATSVQRVVEAATFNPFPEPAQRPLISGDVKSFIELQKMFQDICSDVVSVASLEPKYLNTPGPLGGGDVLIDDEQEIKIVAPAKIPATGFESYLTVTFNVFNVFPLVEPVVPKKTNWELMSAILGETCKAVHVRAPCCVHRL